MECRRGTCARAPRRAPRAARTAPTRLGRAIVPSRRRARRPGGTRAGRAGPSATSSSSSRSVRPARRPSADARAQRSRAVAQPDGVDAARPAVQRARRAERTVAVASSAARGPTVTRVGARVGAPARRAARRRATPMPRRWPTVKCAWPRWRPSTAPRRSTISPGRSRSPPWRARNARAAGAGEEAEVLRVGLGRDRQPGLARRARAPRAWSARRAGSASARATPARSAASM